LKAEKIKNPPQLASHGRKKFLLIEVTCRPKNSDLNLVVAAAMVAFPCRRDAHKAVLKKANVSKFSGETLKRV